MTNTDQVAQSLWTRLSNLKAQGDCHAFVDVVDSALCWKLEGNQGVSFKSLLQGLTQLFQKDPEHSPAFLLGCLQLLLQAQALPAQAIDADAPATPAPASDTDQPSGSSPDELAPVKRPWQTSLPYLLLDAVSPSSSIQPTDKSNDDDTGLDTDPTEAAQPQPEEPTPPPVDSATVQLATQVMHEQLTQGNVKMALRIAAAFGVTSKDIQDSPEVLELLRSCLNEHLAGVGRSGNGSAAASEQEGSKKQTVGGKGGLTTVVGLLMQFEVLGSPQITRSLLCELVTAGLEGLAERWLSQLGTEEKELYVTHCMSLDRYKAAGRIVRQFKMQDRFPEVEKVYRERTFARLMRKHLWQVATQFVGNDTDLQRQLVTAMYDSDPSQAVELAQSWSLPDSFIASLGDPAVRAEAEARRAAQYYPLMVPTSDVLMVDSVSSVQVAHSVLSQASLVGLDVEWKPSGASKASLLQIATPEKIFLFDLLALDNTGDTDPNTADGQSMTDSSSGHPHPHHSVAEYLEAVDACLCSVLQNQACLKLGVEVSGDLRKLARSWPELRAFSEAGPILELRDLWVNYLIQNPSVSHLQRCAGLSTLTETLLGKPLDKTMQVSDWERRPLTPRQLVYAAQDAHVLTTMYLKLCELVPNAADIVADRQYQFKASESSSGPKPLHAQQGPRQASTREPTPQALSRRKRRELAAAAAAAGDGSDQGAAGPGSRATPKPARGAEPLCADTQRDTSAEGGQEVAEDAKAACQAAAGAAVMSVLVAAGLSQCLVPLPAQAATKTGPGMHAANALSVPLSRAVKTMALMYTPHTPEGPGHTDASQVVAHKQVERPVVAVLRGDQRLDMHKVAMLLGVSRKAVRMASYDECVTVFGSVPGWLAPFGLPSPDIPIYLDYSLAPPVRQTGTSSTTDNDTTPPAMMSVEGEQQALQPAADHPHHQPSTSQTEACGETDTEQPPRKFQAVLDLPGASVSVVGNSACDSTVGMAMSGSMAGADADGGQGRQTMPQTVGPGSHTQPQVGAGPMEGVEQVAVTVTPLRAVQQQPAGLQPDGMQVDASGNVEEVAEEEGGDISVLASSGRGDAVLKLTLEQLCQLTGGHIADVAIRAGSAKQMAQMQNMQHQHQLQTGGKQPHHHPGTNVVRKPNEVRFLLDGMLGRLCRWLRCLGVDAEMVNATATRQQMLQQASSSGRVFLTRDAGLSMRRDAAAAAPFLLMASDAETQLREVAQRWGLTFDTDKAMSRCSVCNAADFQVMTLEEARASSAIPDNVLEFVTEFFRCGSCGKIFWMGPKSYSAMQRVESVLTGSKSTARTPTTTPTPAGASSQAPGPSVGQGGAGAPASMDESL